MATNIVVCDAQEGYACGCVVCELKARVERLEELVLPAAEWRCPTCQRFANAHGHAAWCDHPSSAR